MSAPEGANRKYVIHTTVLAGEDPPEGKVAAAIGALYWAKGQLYVKETGADSSHGWAAAQPE